jgi:formamidopyrimidine-DNA glycosylase
MPELPEVETICNGLAQSLTGAHIEKVEQRRDNLRFPFPKNLIQILTYQDILRFRRRAKYIVMDLSNQHSVLLHLGMSGKLLISSPDHPAEKHDHLIIHCNHQRTIRFNDPRRFGMLDLCQTDFLNSHRFLQGLGVEPLEGELTPSYLLQRLRHKTTSIKAALLDQHIIAGLGNIYVCEALFYAGISPVRAAGSIKIEECSLLIESIEHVLRAALKAGGSSLRDYVQSNGQQGGFQRAFAVYDREQQSCPGCTCGQNAIQRITQGGRSTFYCRIKQK